MSRHLWLQESPVIQAFVEIAYGEPLRNGVDFPAFSASLHR
jgi:hypothetical protein